MQRMLWAACLTVGMLATVERAAKADVLTNWTLTPANSSIAWSGSLKQNGSTIASLSQQGTGSLTTTYSGSVAANLTYVGGSPTQIQITGGAITAANSGNWDPLVGGGSGTAPASYGGRFNLSFAGNVNIALRGMTFDLSSAVQSLGGSPGNYSFTNGVTLTTATPSSLDFRTSGLIGSSGGNAPLSGAVLPNTGASSATVVKSAGPGQVATMNIPVNLPGITIPLDTGLDAIFNFAGNLRATTVPSYLQATISGTTQSDGASINVNLGSAIVGASLSSANYGFRNTSANTAADASAMQLTTTGSAAVSPGSFGSNLAALGSQGLTLSINTATAGAKTGTVTVGNLDPLSTDANDNFNLSATVLDHSLASFASGSQVANKTINLGVLPQGATLTVNNAYSVQNLAAPSGFTAPQDLVSVTPGGATATLSSNVAPYANQAAGAGNAQSFNVSLNRGTVGTFSSSYQLNYSDSAMPGATAQATPLSLTLQAQVLPPIAVSSVDAKTVTRFDLSGNATQVASAANGLFTPLDTQFDNKGNLYVADVLTQRLFKIAPDNTISTFANFANGALSPTGLDFNAGNGQLKLANYLTNTVAQYTPPSSTSTTFATAGNGVNTPFDVATDSLGNTYIANLDTKQILKIDSLGMSSVFADATDGLFTPLSLAVDSTNNVYVGDVLTGKIIKFTPAGVGTQFAGIAQGVFSPTGLAFDDGGNLFVANYLGNNVLKITPGGSSSVFANTTLPWGVSVFRTPTLTGPLLRSAQVPEPSTWALLAIGLAAVTLWKRRSGR